MGECEVDNEASVSSGGQALAWRYVGDCFKHFLMCKCTPLFFCFLMELEVPMGAIWYHLVSPNENIAASELVM